MPSHTKPLSAELSAQWAAAAQYRFLEALMSDPRLEIGRIAFHGGTSLHFSWRSPRLSEDLDFLLAGDMGDIRTIVERACGRTAEAFRADDPDFNVEVNDKARRAGRLVSYHIKVSHSGYLGKALIKVEFWRVDAEYLAKYPVELRTPVRPGEMVSLISVPVPAATLETAYCDKLTAFATRPFLKWRDIYDLWWIGTQTDARLDLATVVPQFLHNVSAYETIAGLPPARALREFLKKDPARILGQADPDLKRWMPAAVWERLHPRVTEEMVEYTRHALRSVADAIEKKKPGASLKRIKP